MTSAQVQARELRNAFGCFPTGVTVVTCLGTGGARVGVTANSFVSLSLSPPLVAVALYRNARHLQAFLEHDSFTVNVLRSDQHALSRHFARPSECSWDGVGHRLLEDGHLVLEGAVASFLCRRTIEHPVGDHLLLVGEIEQFSYDPNAEPLAFCRGRYGGFRADWDVAAPEAASIWPSPEACGIGWG